MARYIGTQVAIVIVHSRLTAYAALQSAACFTSLFSSGLSQASIAKKLDVSASALSKYLKKRRREHDHGAEGDGEGDGEGTLW